MRDAATSRAPRVLASMGPRHHRRGSKGCGLAWNQRDQLQWGRDIIVADRGATNAQFQQSSLLQWGRDIIVADRAWRSRICARSRSLQWGRDIIVADRFAREYRERVARRFNGAATSSSRIVPRWTSVPASGRTLQWGRDIIVADRITTVTPTSARPTLQWGRDIIVADRSWPHRDPRRDRSFNGAATSSSRIDEH